jgi:ubiquinol-cytochrome c reductase cytochrome b/c1 subunit
VIYGLLVRRVVSLPTRSSLNYSFNGGSFLGLALCLQVGRGVLLVLNYSPSDSYNTVIFIVNETKGGWLLKLFHRNNARVIFFTLYLHLYKNIFYCSYRLGAV